MRNLLRISIILLFCCFGVGAIQYHVAAQESATADLKIESVDIDNLPNVTITVQGKNLADSVNELPLSIREDGAEQEILSQSVVERGLQIALVLDPALDLRTVGKSGDAIQFEVANSASSLIQAGILSVQSDLLSAFAISDESRQFTQLTGWLRDHQAVVNKLYQYQPVEAISQPGLSAILDDVLDAFLASPEADDVKQTIVLFSDGSALLENSEINQAILKAQEQGVAIQVVLLGDGNTLTRRNLMSIATATDGKFTTYNNPSSLTSIWQKLDEGSRLQKLTYRLGSANPEQIAVSLLANGTESIVATEDFPELGLAPVQIKVTSSETGGTIERGSANSGAGLVQLEPKILPVEIEFDWPDNVQRNIESVEYTLNGVVSTQNEGPFETYELSIIDLDEGTYSLDVMATDEYGLSGNSEPISIQVKTNSLVSGDTTNTSSSENTNDSSDTNAITEELEQSDESNQGMNILGLQLPETIDIFGVTFLVNGITLLIALFPIIFLLALFLYWLTQRNEQQAEPDYGYYEYDNNGYFYRFEPSTDDMQLTQPQVSVIEPEEDLTMPVKLPSFYTTAAAYLIYVSGGEHLPKKIAVETSEPVRIGRKKSFCDQILDDQRVSRLHSVITYEGGNFYIKDEGSSGGTFVNRRKLGPTDKQLLKHNDIINFNEVEYRMEVPEPDSNAHVNGEVEFGQPSNDAESVIS